MSNFNDSTKLFKYLFVFNNTFNFISPLFANFCNRDVIIASMTQEKCEENPDYSSALHENTSSGVRYVQVLPTAKHAGERLAQSSDIQRKRGGNLVNLRTKNCSCRVSI